MRVVTWAGMDRLAREEAPEMYVGSSAHEG